MSTHTTTDPLPTREEAFPAIATQSARDASRLRTRALSSLGLLAAIFVALQPISDALARPALLSLIGPDAASIQWSQYLAGPAPDVLVIGDSRARVDVDVDAVSAAVSASMGRRITVGKLGVNAEQPDFFDALTYRVLSREPHPSLVVFNLPEYAFSSRYKYDSTEDLWQISKPFDPGFDRYALGTATDPGRLVRGWLLPILGNYSVIARSVRCGNSRRDPTNCDPVPSDPAGLEAWYRANIHAVMVNYDFSAEQADHVQAAQRLAHERGVAFGLLVFPAFQVPEWEPEGYCRFLAGVQALAGRLDAPVVDLHREVQDAPGLWSDPLHLNPAGARAVAGLLGMGLASELVSGAPGAKPAAVPQMAC